LTRTNIFLQNHSLISDFQVKAFEKLHLFSEKVCKFNWPKHFWSIN